MKINKPHVLKTHEGAKAKHINAEQALRRSVLSCMLWENSFYESGQSIADRILELCGSLSVDVIGPLAVECRHKFKIRHASLLLLLAIIKKGGPRVSKYIRETISRPDELAELVALYWRDGKKPLSKQMKIGLGMAFNDFNEHQFAKWDRPGLVSIRDVMFLCHAKPLKHNEELFKKIANKTLDRPNTWESRMAGGEDKKTVFEDLLKTNKLGYMALLKNLRGMVDSGVDRDLIKHAISNPSDTVLPFRFISAAKHAPSFMSDLEKAMLKCLESMDRLTGKTIVLVDVSGSMLVPLSSKSELFRLDAASALAILISGISDDCRMFTFSNSLVEIGCTPSLFLIEAIKRSQENGGTRLGFAINAINSIGYDRLIVLTDEQSNDPVPNPRGKAYMINVGIYKNGVGYGPWVHIDGFSEACVSFIQEIEKETASTPIDKVF